MAGSEVAEVEGINVTGVRVESRDVVVVVRDVVLVVRDVVLVVREVEVHTAVVGQNPALLSVVSVPES